MLYTIPPHDELFLSQVYLKAKKKQQQLQQQHRN